MTVFVSKRRSILHAEFFNATTFRLKAATVKTQLYIDFYTRDPSIYIEYIDIQVKNSGVKN